MPRTNVDMVETKYRRFNDFVRGEMKRKKVTQKKLAEYLAIGQSALSQRISGNTEWLFRDVLKVMEYLEADIYGIF